jgi:hypothetical protein
LLKPCQPEHLIAELNRVLQQSRDQVSRPELRRIGRPSSGNRESEVRAVRLADDGTLSQNRVSTCLPRRALP